MNDSERDIKYLAPQMIAAAVERAIPQLACNLAPDVLAALEAAADAADAAVGAKAPDANVRAAAALQMLRENARIAARDQVPLCQDTGYVWVGLEIGPDVSIAGDAFSLVDEAVARAYQAAGLRKSIVRDALCDRTNTGSNAPAVCEVLPVQEPGARLRIMLKGGGSDNAGCVAMLSPGAGVEGIVDAVVARVREKAANACPPLVLGVGVGGTFATVARLAKTALFRTLGEPARDPQAAALEARLLAAVNATGVGAAGQGGPATALAVHVNTAPCHIAALPVAVDFGCTALRRTTIEL